MRIAPVLTAITLILAIAGSSCNPAQNKARSDESSARIKQVDAAQANVKIALKAPSGAAILFKTENGQDVDASGQKGNNIPYLVLNRNGATTPMIERMLRITVDNLQVPPPGLFVKLEIATQHMDPDCRPRKHG